MNNRKRITLASFLAYFVMSGMLAPMGIISSPMSEHFAQPVTEITARFGWLTIGILAGAIISLVIFDWFRLRTLLMGVYTVIFGCLISLNFVDNVTLIGLTLGLVGACCGIGLAGAALVISRSYETERRASMLVVTDGSFSAAGVVCSWVAIFLLAREYHWSGVYQFVAMIAALIVFLSFLSTFPTTDADERKSVRTETWPIPIWLCIVGSFLYTLGQWAFLLWLPSYAETELGTPREQAGQLVGQFWTGMFAAQIFVAWWVLKIGVSRLVLISAVATSFFSIPLWVIVDIDVLIVMSTIWGFANLGLLKVVLSFATQMLQRPTARLVASLLLGATVGTAVSPWLTSQIVMATDKHFILQFGTACYAALTVLLLTASRMYRTIEVSVAGRSGA